MEQGIAGITPIAPARPRQRRREITADKGRQIAGRICWCNRSARVPAPIEKRHRPFVGPGPTAATSGGSRFATPVAVGGCPAGWRGQRHRRARPKRAKPRGRRAFRRQQDLWSWLLLSCQLLQGPPPPPPPKKKKKPRFCRCCANPGAIGPLVGWRRGPLPRGRQLSAGGSRARARPWPHQDSPPSILQLRPPAPGPTWVIRWVWAWIQSKVSLPARNRVPAARRIPRSKAQKDLAKIGASATATPVPLARSLEPAVGSSPGGAPGRSGRARHEAKVTPSQIGLQAPPHLPCQKSMLQPFKPAWRSTACVRTTALAAWRRLSGPGQRQWPLNREPTRSSRASRPGARAAQRTAPPTQGRAGGEIATGRGPGVRANYQAAGGSAARAQPDAPARLHLQKWTIRGPLGDVHLSWTANWVEPLPRPINAVEAPTWCGPSQCDPDFQPIEPGPCFR